MIYEKEILVVCYQVRKKKKKKTKKEKGKKEGGGEIEAIARFLNSLPLSVSLLSRNKSN